MNQLYYLPLISQLVACIVVAIKSLGSPRNIVQPAEGIYAQNIQVSRNVEDKRQDPKDYVC